jgi:hypothetical protein
VVKGIEPKDQVEAMLAAQMAAVHLTTMTFARRLANVENIPQQDSAERSFNKLARTFTTQLEALKRYRTGGEQKVTVQHVHVHEGGQAIVGTVERPVGGAKQQSKDQPYGLGHASGTPMPSALETNREAVPLAGREGLARMSNARRRRWRPGRQSKRPEARALWSEGDHGKASHR